MQGFTKTSNFNMKFLKMGQISKILPLDVLHYIYNKNLDRFGLLVIEISIIKFDTNFLIIDYNKIFAIFTQNLMINISITGNPNRSKFLS